MNTEVGIAQMVMAQLMPLGVSAVSVLLSWGMGEGIRWLRAKTRNDKAISALDYIHEVTMTTVAKYENTIKQQLMDGVWSEAEKKELKLLAFNDVKTQVPVSIKNAAEIAVTSFDEYINSKIEEAVLETKLKSAVARSGL